MKRQHDFNILQRRQRQRIRDSKLAESLASPISETVGSSPSRVSPSSSEGIESLYGTTCGKSCHPDSSVLTTSVSISDPGKGLSRSIFTCYRQSLDRH
jgi:hypothetical protein